MARSSLDAAIATANQRKEHAAQEVQNKALALRDSVNMDFDVNVEVIPFKLSCTAF